MSKSIDELQQMLVEGTKAIYASDRYKQTLECMAKFHHYSVRNTILIMLQMPHATAVAGYKTWQNKFNRSVKRGEKGIKVLGGFRKKVQREPDVVINAEGEPEKKAVREYLVFKPVTVFDVSQTEGEPLPTIYNGALQGDVSDFQALKEAIIKVAPVPVVFDPQSEAMGYRNPDMIVVKAGLSELQTIKTLLHELAHARMHSDETLDREHKEVEAESVAFIVCSALGLDTSDYSFPYIAGWGDGDEQLEVLEESLERIRGVATQLIEEIGEIKSMSVEQKQKLDETIYITSDGYLELSYSAPTECDYTVWGLDLHPSFGGSIEFAGDKDVLLAQICKDCNIQHCYHEIPQGDFELLRKLVTQEPMVTVQTSDTDAVQCKEYSLFELNSLLKKGAQIECDIRFVKDGELKTFRLNGVVDDSGIPEAVAEQSVAEQQLDEPDASFNLSVLVPYLEQHLELSEREHFTKSELSESSDDRCAELDAVLQWITNCRLELNTARGVADLPLEPALEAEKRKQVNEEKKTSRGISPFVSFIKKHFGREI